MFLIILLVYFNSPELIVLGFDGIVRRLHVPALTRETKGKGKRAAKRDNNNPNNNNNADNIGIHPLTGLFHSIVDVEI